MEDLLLGDEVTAVEELSLVDAKVAEVKEIVPCFEEIEGGTLVVMVER